MRRTPSYEAAKTRTAIYLTGGLICAGLSAHSDGMMISATVLLILAYREHGEARIVRAEDHEAEESRRSACLSRLSPGDLLEDSSAPAGPAEPFVPPVPSAR